MESLFNVMHLPFASAQPFTFVLSLIADDQFGTERKPRPSPWAFRLRAAPGDPDGFGKGWGRGTSREQCPRGIERTQYLSQSTDPAHDATRSRRSGACRKQSGRHHAVIAAMASGNHAPERLSGVAPLDVPWLDARHLAFGRLTHSCLGERLAHIGRQSVPGTLLRCPPVLRGVKALPVLFGAISPRGWGAAAWTRP